MLLADTREPKTLLDMVVRAIGAVQVEQLPYGDYHLTASDGTLVVIHRETPGDLLNSIRDGSLARKLTDCPTPHLPILLREGTFSELTMRGWNVLAIKNLILSLKVNGFVDELTLDYRDTVRRLKELVDWFSKPYHLALHTQRFESSRELAALTWIRGVGPQRAKALRNRFGSIRSVVNATEQELADVEGIGPETAAAIYRAVRETVVVRGSG